MTQFSANINILKKNIPQNKSWFSKLAIVVQFSLSPKITIFGKYLVHVYFLITAPPLVMYKLKQLFSYLQNCHIWKMFGPC